MNKTHGYPGTLSFRFSFDCFVSINITLLLDTLFSASSAPAVVYEYIVSVELNISEAAVITQLRTILRNISYPINISNQIQIYDVSISVGKNSQFTTNIIN